MLTYIITACMTTAIMMAGSSLGKDQKPQMEIDLEGTTNLVPPLTQSLNITCSLVPATDSDLSEKADFKTIIGVYINLKAPGKREEADAAKIIISDPDNATLSGLLPRATIMGSGLNEGFIKVGVAAPDNDHAGEYTCKVVGFNTAGDHVTLTHTASVQHKAPDVGDLAKYVHQLELQQEKKDASQDENVASQISNIKTKNQNQDTDISNIKTKNGKQDTDITNIKTKNQNQETDIYNIETKNRNQDADITNIKTKNWKQDTEISNIKTKNRNQDTEISNIKTKNRNQDTEISNIKTKNQNQDTEINKRVSKADIQRGTEWCYPGMGLNADTVQITFPHRYSKAPRVFISTRHFHGNHAFDVDQHTGSEYFIQAKDVTQTGFKLYCHVYKHSYISNMSVYWIAFPSP